MTAYAELEITTNFSFLRGGSHPEELVATAKALGLAAIAVTDRNTLAGVVRAHLAAKEVGGIKFIVGCRLDLDDALSLLVYPQDRAAYGRLCRLLTLGQRRADKGKCILHLADVASHAEGMIFIVLPPEELNWLPRGRVKNSIPPLDGEGGAPGGVNSTVSASIPPPRRRFAASDLPTRGRYGAINGGAENILGFPPHPHPLPQKERGRCGSAANSNPSPFAGVGGQPDPLSGAPGEADNPSPGKGEGGDGQRPPPGGGHTSRPRVVSDPLPNPPPCRGRDLGVATHSPLPPCGGARLLLEQSEGGKPQSRGPSLTPIPALPQGGEGASGVGSERQLEFESQLHRIKQALPSCARLYLAARHSYRGDDRANIEALARIAERVGTPLVATNAVLYHAAHRRPLQDVLTCIREKCTIHDAGLKLEANAERHLKSPLEIARLFAGHEDALARTVEIAQACSFSLGELKYEYPDEPVPEGKTPQAHLADLTFEGAAWRFPDGVPDKVRDTLNRELALIDELHYARYFLTVHDIVHYAREIGILCQGRGSAANSAVCYCLAITNVDPTEIDLLFERFVSPERKEPPDIDVDFEHERREEVIQYIYGRYGRDRAGIAATVISYRGRSAVREVGKALGLSEDTVAALATTIWGLSNSGLPKDYVRQAGLDPSDPLLSRCLELTQELIGFPRHLSQHVGGFVLTRGPLSEVVPIGNAAMEDRTFIEWDKDDLDALGLLKVDVLGLGMLTCIRKGFALVKEHYGRDLSLGTVPPDDPAVYDMLCKADSIGVFQVESRAQMNMLPRLKPRKFYDLVIEVAIVRPGPIQGDMVHPYLRRRCGEEAVEFPSPHPDHGPKDELRQVLGKTMGVPLFQEQAMRLAMVAAKFSGPEANELRRAMATFRRRGTIERLHQKMVGRMTARGYPAEFAERCFNQIKGFGEYGFPESHAASFAHLVYVSAFIKCHYPAAFAAALLNSQPMGFYAPAQIVRCAVDHGVEAREADANHSLWDCTLEPASWASANSSLPPCGGARLREVQTEGGKSPTHNLPLTPLHKGGGGASGDGTEKTYALRLGLRQIDGLREDDARGLVSIRDGIPPEHDPHLFAPPPAAVSPLPPCGGAGAARGAEGGNGIGQGAVLTDEIPPPGAPARADLPTRGRYSPRGAANSNPPPLAGEGGANSRSAAAPGEGLNPSPGAGKGGDDLRSSPGGGHMPGRDHRVKPAIGTDPLPGPPPSRVRELFHDTRDLWRRSGLSRASLERLAAADAFRSLGLDRRQALWEVRGLPRDVALPLFDSAAASDISAEQRVTLPIMPLSEHVVNDYRTLRLSLKAHPMSFLRARVARAGILSCADLRQTRDGARTSVAGVVLVRQRPGSAAGVVFMTIEDETGVANSVIWPKVLERERKVVMGASLVVVHGSVQRHEDIIHVIAERLEDRSDWLRLLDEDGDDLNLPVANADEVKRPDQGSCRPSRAGEPMKIPLAAADHVKHPEARPEQRGERLHPRWHPRKHPRTERIIPKSRDFH